MEVRGREIRSSAVDQKILNSGSIGIHLKTNGSVYLKCDNAEAPSDAITINCNSKELPRLVKPNDLIYVDDGKIILLVSECDMVRDALH